MIRELPDAGSTTLGVVLRLAIQRSTVWETIRHFVGMKLR